MVNKYLFRGKRIDNDEWVRGFLSVDEKGQARIEITNNYGGYAESFYIYPNTAGQCTGLCDCTDELIFENDTVRYKGYVSNVFWENGGFYVKFWSGGTEFLGDFNEEVEIVGDGFAKQ